MNPTFHRKPDPTGERREFYDRLAQRSVAPLWEVLGDIVRTEPRTACVPALWRYDELRPLILESGGMITAREAERRVLILENPGLHGQSRITQSVYAGMQLVLPGEVAPSHRHTASALRFIIEGEGAYTAVNGERTTMHPGDLILTPSWTYHDHGNPSGQPVVWLDGLDIPLVNSFDTSFAEHYAEETQPVTRSEGDSQARFGANLLPLEYQPPRHSAPLVSYTYTSTRATLEQLRRNGPMDACHGIKMRYANPATGGYPLPTLGAFIQWLPSGFQGRAYRSTDATVYGCVEGRGRSQAGGAALAWKPHDVFVIPSWCPVSHEAEEESILFSFSDRPAQQALGIWREESPIRETP